MNGSRSQHVCPFFTFEGSLQCYTIKPEKADRRYFLSPDTFLPYTPAVQNLAFGVARGYMKLSEANRRDEALREAHKASYLIYLLSVREYGRPTSLVAL